MVFNGPPDVKGCGFGKSLSNTSLPTVHRAQLLNLCVSIRHQFKCMYICIYTVQCIYTGCVSKPERAA